MESFCCWSCLGLEFPAHNFWLMSLLIDLNFECGIFVLISQLRLPEENNNKYSKFDTSKSMSYQSCPYIRDICIEILIGRKFSQHKTQILVYKHQSEIVTSLLHWLLVIFQYKVRNPVNGRALILIHRIKSMQICQIMTWYTRQKQ